MTDRQLTIDGTEVPHPLPKPRTMTRRQKDLWLWAALVPEGVITADDARRFFKAPYAALYRLEAFGVMQRVGHGKWRAI